MNSNMVFETAEELHLFTEKKAYFLGTAKVRLRNLGFEHEKEDLPGARTLDDRNVARLKNIFELEGCLRLDPEHHVPAIINVEELNAVIQQSPEIQAGQLQSCQTPPLLEFGEKVLTCIHGRHRIAAASKILSPRDKWWTVDFYSAGKYKNFSQR